MVSNGHDNNHSAPSFPANMNMQQPQVSLNHVPLPNQHTHPHSHSSQAESEQQQHQLQGTIDSAPMSLSAPDVYFLMLTATLLHRRPEFGTVRMTSVWAA
ncbi:hypothetical protein PCANC_23493 [Puccinia coronata f. sp. avenae]|uniref:Uncharacterized protein n=1 Tax=Puccinia coronata f. sp. avenae TaxID=200324 RepID=A0A2N5RU13_9BASI|nr:hypothetical protein PCASD_26664 [Puccinia coronata f. sp. avenae]PLW28693.1 hypothetical protein PCANC_23493 [Puccinia coronata f. sp. avenae]PLW45496.1 hypothetical protein PCASD_05968 [Puccinia coronata f. sp. avenae]